MNTNDEQHEHEQGAVPGPSIPVLLVCTADVILRGGAPEPARVEMSVRFGLWVTLTTHVQLHAWADVLGLSTQPLHSQPYIRDGVLCQLTDVYGRWRDAAVTLHCVEPVDAIAALRGDDGQVCR